MRSIDIRIYRNITLNPYQNFRVFVWWQGL